MGFIIHEKKMTSADPIPEGQVSIDKRGTLTVRSTDLALVRIKDTAIILSDELTLRIALRAPRLNEQRKAYAVARIFREKNQPDPDWRRIGLRSAISAINLEPAAVAGRYTLMTKEDLVIINLTDATDDQKDDEIA